MYNISKVVDFCAAHSIKGAGRCANKHGHNWKATINVAFDGVLDGMGFVCDVREIKDAAFKYDHDDLDKYFEFASTENVAAAIAHDVMQILEASESEGYYDVHVHLAETENNAADAFVSTFPKGDPFIFAKETE